jgi:hypothetical protein
VPFIFPYGGWGSGAARCLGNRVTGYHSISSVTFRFSYRSGSSLQASVVIVGANTLVASADISSLLPLSGSSSVTATFSTPAVLDPQGIYYVVACATGGGDGQYNLMATDGPAAAAFCYSSFETCVSSEPNWGW